jgi:hypothetical protein
MTVKAMKDKRKNLIILTISITIILLALLFIISPHLQTTYMTHQTFMTRITNSTTETTSAVTASTSKTDKTEMKSIKSLIYIKRGGAKGVYNILEISKPNEAIYTCIFSPRFGNRSFILSTNDYEIDLLFRKIVNEYGILDYSGKIYKARNVYDYFTYEIFLELEDGESVRVKWVDEWASEEPIPQNLTHIKEVLENFIRQRTISCE